MELYNKTKVVNVILSQFLRVASDLTFTDNEIYTTYNHPTGTIYPLPAPHSSFGTSTGTGSFGTNTIIIQFDALIFTGIKL